LKKNTETYFQLQIALCAVRFWSMFVLFKIFILFYYVFNGDLTSFTSLEFYASKGGLQCGPYMNIGSALTLTRSLLLYLLPYLHLLPKVSFLVKKHVFGPPVCVVRG
jgi:hypothetical protein